MQDLKEAFHSNIVCLLYYIYYCLFVILFEIIKSLFVDRTIDWRTMKSSELL